VKRAEFNFIEVKEIIIMEMGPKYLIFDPIVGKKSVCVEICQNMEITKGCIMTRNSREGGSKWKMIQN